MTFVQLGYLLGPVVFTARPLLSVNLLIHSFSLDPSVTHSSKPLNLARVKPNSFYSVPMLVPGSFGRAAIQSFWLTPSTSNGRYG